MRFPFALLACALLAATTPAPASAKPFDLIYADQADIVLCEGCGIMLAEYSYAILVNTGPTPITVAEMDGAVFHATGSVPGFTFTPLLNDWGGGFTDLPPGHARGPGIWPLSPLVLPTETLEDTWTMGMQFLAFEVRRQIGNTYQGPVNFHVTLDLAGNWVEYDVLAQVHLGGPDVSFSHAVRQSSTFPPLATHPSTWGAIKTLYR